MIELDVADIIAIRTLDASQAEFGFVYDIHDDAVQILELRIIKNKLPENSGATPLADSDIQGGRLPEGAAVLINRMTLIAKGSVIRKLGRVGVEKIDEIYRKLSHRIASKHYSCVHSRRNRITPGTDYIAYAGRVYDENDMIALMDSCLDFWLTEGRFAERFKTALADHIGARHCILTNSGSSANLLAVSALTSPRLGNRRLKPGDEVITVAACFPTTVAPLVQNDLVPVFVDIEPGTYNIDASKIEEALTEKTRAPIVAPVRRSARETSPVGATSSRTDVAFPARRASSCRCSSRRPRRSPRCWSARPSPRASSCTPVGCWRRRSRWWRTASSTA